MQRKVVGTSYHHHKVMKYVGEGKLLTKNSYSNSKWKTASWFDFVLYF